MKLPSFDLQRFSSVVFAFDGEDDIAYIHFNGPRSAVTERVGNGWYLRIEADEVAGMELHGLNRTFLSTPFYAQLFLPAMRELQHVTGVSIEDGSVRAEGTVDQLPQMAHLTLLLVGQALEKYEALIRAENEDAAQRLLAG